MGANLFTANQMGSHTGKSIVSSCEGENSKLEGSYRFIRNDRVDADKIAETGFNTIAKSCNAHEKILLLEDSTTLGYSHQVKKELGDLGGSKASQRRGYWVHNVLAVDAQTESTIGLVEQSYWLQKPEERGKSAQRKSRPYEDKESFKY